MAITAEFVKQLVEHPESDTLDVKGDQYPFTSRDNDEKSEILKDILAFANALVSDDAFILVGVQERKPPPHRIVGISTNLDDASLQQFVSAKQDRCPKFSYQEVRVDGVTVGVIRIPPQRGPFFVKQDFGVLKRTQVPMRQGTSTAYPSHDQYLELALQHDRATNFGPEAQRLNTTVDRAMQNQLVRLQAVAVDSADQTFDHCSELLRLGEVDSAMAEIERVLENADLMGELTDEQRARAFRVKANLLLRQNDVSGAEEHLQRADSFAGEEEPRIHAMVALHRSGIREAIRVLGTPKTDDGRQLAAQLLIADEKPEQAIALLPDDEPRPINTLRPGALAQLLLGDREGALATANEAFQREPSWLDSLITAGMAHYFSALSPAFKPSQMLSPDPVPPPLFRADPIAFDHLEIAERHFRTAMGKRLTAYDQLNVELWLLAVLALQPSRREDANAVLNSILSKEPTHTIAVLWAISHGLNFDREAIRQRCRAELSDDIALASHVVTYLVLEPEPSAVSLEFLAQYRHLFEPEDQMDVYDYWQTRLIEETSEDGLNASDLTVHGIIAQCRERGDWSKIQQLISDNPKDPIILTIAAEALADAQQWLAVAKLSGRLITEVSTEFAYRLAATALINVGEDRECIAVIQQWEDRFSDSQLPSVEFWRLRSTALARFGDVTGAIESVTTLLGQTGSPRDIGHAAEIYLRVGDVRAAAPHIADLIKQDHMSAAEAINWSRAVQHDDQSLAEELLDHAAAKGVAPALAAAAYDMATRLNRDDLRNQFFGALAAAADIPGTGVQSANLDDVVSWMRSRRARVADVNNLYLKGQIPLVMACSATNDNVALRFESAFGAYRSEKWTDALLIYHGSRVQPMPDLPDISEWIICLDLTTLFVLEELDLLAVLKKSAREIRFPFELPSALLEIGDQLAPGQPGRLAILNDILQAIATGTFQSNLGQPESSNEKKTVRVVFEANNTDDSMPLVGLHHLFETAVTRGVIDSDEARSAIQAQDHTSDSRLQSDMPDNPVLLFDGNTIEVALEVFGMERLCAFATCVIESDYEKVIRTECQLGELRQKALARVTRLRRKISAGVQAGEYELFPQLAADIVAENSVNNSLDAVLLSLLSQPAEPGCTVAFDDRFLNKHRSTAHNPIICTLDIIEYLRKVGAISTKECRGFRARLRDSNIYFAFPDPDDVIYALSQTKQQEGVLLETPRLKGLRRYVARSQALQEYLDVQPSRGPPNEVPLALAIFRLTAHAVEATFADETLDLEDATARATWIWQSLHQTTDKLLPLNNRTASSIRYILAVQLSSLLGSAMTTFMVSGREHREEWMGSQIDWVWETCIRPYLEGNSELLDSVAQYLRQCVDPLLEGGPDDASDDEKEEVRRATRAYVARFVMALPQVLRECVLGDTNFAERFGMGIQSIAEVAGVMIEHTVFRQSIIDAVLSRAPQSFETKSGPATVTLDKRGTVKRPTVLEFTGTLSLKYEDPFLGLLGRNRHQRFTKLLNQTDWIDLPPIELAELPDQCNNLSDHEFYDLLDQFRRANVQHHYQQLAISMAQRKPLGKPDFDAPPPRELLQTMRLPIHSRKRLSFLLDTAAASLIDQYGAMHALERLSGLPVDLASRFVDPFFELVKQNPRKTKRWLLSPGGSVLHQLHKMAISAALASRGMLSLALLRKTLRRLLAEWQRNAKLFAQVLKTTDQLLSQQSSVTELAAEQHLAIVWSHAERIAGIVGDNFTQGDEGVEYFRKIAHLSLAGALRIDKAYETDVAVPDALYPPLLLHFGMGYLHSQCDSLLSKPLMREIDKLLRLADDLISPLSPRLLQVRTGGLDCLDSFLKVINSDFRTEFNSVNDGRAQPVDWFSERRFEIANGTAPSAPESLLWSEVLAHEQRWLDPSTRLALLRLMRSIEWPELVASSEEAAICVLMLAADMIAYLDDEPTANEIANHLMTACIAAAPPAVSDLDGTSNDSPLTFRRTITEVAYRMARSTDMGRSCRVLANTLRTLADQTAALEGRIIELLDTAIPMLPVEHVLPLVELRRALRCDN